MKTSQFIANTLANLGVIGMGLGMWDKDAGFWTWFMGLSLCIYGVYLHHKGESK